MQTKKRYKNIKVVFNLFNTELWVNGRQMAKSEDGENLGVLATLDAIGFRYKVVYPSSSEKKIYTVNVDPNQEPRTR